MSNPITADRRQPSVGSSFSKHAKWIDPGVIGEDPGKMVDPVSAAD
jgi:hypothetical protein